MKQQLLVAPVILALVVASVPRPVHGGVPSASPSDHRVVRLSDRQLDVGVVTAAPAGQRSLQANPVLAVDSAKFMVVVTNTGRTSFVERREHFLLSSEGDIFGPAVASTVATSVAPHAAASVQLTYNIPAAALPHLSLLYDSGQSRNVV
jgi:hypothetical protein